MTLEKLMADPLMLADVLKYHVLAGKLSYDDLVAAGKIKTLQGGELMITASEDDGATFEVNGAMVMNFPYIDLNGMTVWFIQDQVLMPAK
ncbi:MAG: fasciclin domain-containing protein [Anaerolineae bacterium]